MGGMQLHGQIHQMTVPVHGHVTGDQLTAACEFLIPYAEWGLDSPGVLSARQIIRSKRGLRGGLNVTIFPAFAYLLPALRKIPPNLFWVSDLVDVKVETQGHIIWAAEPEARVITVLVPPVAQVKTHPGL